MKVLTTNEMDLISGGARICPEGTEPGNTSQGTAATVVKVDTTGTVKIDIKTNVIDITGAGNNSVTTTTLNCYVPPAGTYSSWCSYNSSLMDRTGLTEDDLLSAF